MVNTAKARKPARLIVSGPLISTLGGFRGHSPALGLHRDVIGDGLVPELGLSIPVSGRKHDMTTSLQKNEKDLETSTCAESFQLRAGGSLEKQLPTISSRKKHATSLHKRNSPIDCRFLCFFSLLEVSSSAIRAKGRQKIR